MSGWTDEKREQVIAMYKEAEATPENSLEIVAQIAEEVEESANGVRMILTKAGVYIKKATASTGKASASAEGKTPRVSKQASQDALSAAIEAAGQTVDEDIVSKLTGKAAVYFTDLINAVVSD